MRNWPVFILLFCALLAAGYPATGQTHEVNTPEVTGSEVIGQEMEEPEDLWTLFPTPEKAVPRHSEALEKSTHDIHILASAGFYIYKTLISSQDKPSCVFTPSCSEYALESIRTKGLLVGWVSTFDRLCRCHGLVRPEHYPFDMETQRYHDPVH